MNKKEIFRTIKFTLFSISAGLVEIGVFTLLNFIPNWSYWPKYLIALVASVVWNFTLNREFTFKATNNVPVAMFKVAIFYAMFTPASTIFGNYLAEKLLWNEFIVTALNMIANFVLEYLWDTFVVFRGSIDTKETKRKEVKE